MVEMELERSPKGWPAFHQVWQDIINACSAKFRGCEQSLGYLGTVGNQRPFESHSKKFEL